MAEAWDAIAERQGGVVLRRQLTASGLTRSDVRRGERQLWRRVRRAVYADRLYADLVDADPARSCALAAAAASARLDGPAVVSFESAAVLWSLPTLGRRHKELQLTRPRRGKGVRRYPGVVVHHAALPPGHVTVRHEVAVTTVARTVSDLARGSLRAGLVAADAALRRSLCSRDELLAVAADCARWPGIRRARTVAELADPRSESPLESISRAAFHEWGVPAPELQEWVTPYDRVDFLWKRERVIGEADGRTKYATRDDLIREKERQDQLERLGYRVVRWSWRDAYHRPDAVAAWIQTALRG